MYNKNVNIKVKKRFFEVMKKTIVCAILAVAGVFSLHGANSISEQSPEFFIKSFSALTVGYDKSMSEKTIKAAVICKSCPTLPPSNACPIKIHTIPKNTPTKEVKSILI